jgi:hypothetical protein
LVCKAGHYCPDTSTTAVNHDDNYICAAGYLCPAGTTVEPSTDAATYACPLGYYCTIGTTAAVNCLAGTYRSTTGGESISNCTQTPAGKWTGAAATTTGTDCNAGYYCEAGSTSGTSIPCPVATVRTTTGAGTLEECVACTKGYYCGEATSVPTICPQGSYCVEGSKTGVGCPIGTFGASLGLTAMATNTGTSDTGCFDCFPGMYCSQVGLKAPDGLCDMGYFCVSKSSTPNPTDGTTGNACIAGGFCDMGSFKSVSCKPGTFNSATLATSEAECIACTAGKYCSGEFISAETGDCTAGYYCEAGSTIATAIAAAPGYYTGVGASAQIICPEGYYQPEPGSSSCLGCLEGYSCPTEGLAELITLCPTGFYCPTNTTAGTAGSINPTRCPIGTFNQFTHQILVSDCQDCTPGSYCNIEGLSAVAGTCSAGYFCKTKSTLQQPETEDGAGNFGPCPVGHYCEAGTAEPIDCPPGKYNALTKKTLPTDCLTCTQGTYCTDSGRNLDGVDCSAGFYCVAGSTQPKPAAGKCTAGNMCPLGSYQETPCAAGTYQDQAEQGSCIICPSGYFCLIGASTYTATPCPVGHY